MISVSLKKNNNYFKLSSYRKNYEKYTNGPKADSYIDLDFAYLIELARIDVEVRHTLLKMCLDIEHFLKVALITGVEANLGGPSGEDGYKIVSDYIRYVDSENYRKHPEQTPKQPSTIRKKLRADRNNPYCGDLLKKYADDMPIWAFVELISFGDLKDLVQYYSNSTGWVPPVDLKSLDRVRQIRNAAAHNNCIINDLKASSSSSEPPRFITDFVSHAGIKKDTRKKRLSNKRIEQIVHLFYIYDRVVTSTNTREIRLSFTKFSLTPADQSRIILFTKKNLGFVKATASAVALVFCADQRDLDPPSSLPLHFPCRRKFLLIYCRGVMPTASRKVRIKWLTEENARNSAISASVRSE